MSVSLIRPMLHVIGVLIVILGLAMLVPAVVDRIYANPDWRVFVASGAVTMFVGITLILVFRGEHTLVLTLRQTFLLTTLSWVILTAFAALPFQFSTFDIGYVDAYFEAMSGITTTGSTVLVGLDTAPPGILLWRAILQWLGGIGVIVMGVAILPILNVGGMQLLRTEWSDTSDKALPRTAEIAAAMFRVYVALTIACAVALAAEGMAPFDAVTHAMTTLSTGGFSTSDASIGHYASAAIEWTLVLFMVLGGVTFTLYIQVFHRGVGALTRSSQVRTFLLLLALASLMVTVWRWRIEDVALAEALRSAVFGVVSIATTTGFTTTDYSAWGPFAVVIFFLLTFFGGCTGSTSGGIKVYRLQILFQAAQQQMVRLFSPHRVAVARYDGTPIPDAVFHSVASFFFLYIATFVILVLGLGLIGLDLDTSLSGAATALANVGPGLGPVIGPAGNFAPLPDAAKMLLAAGMLLGRLELWTVFILLLPSFWRR